MLGEEKHTKIRKLKVKRKNDKRKKLILFSFVLFFLLFIIFIMLNRKNNTTRFTYSDKLFNEKFKNYNKNMYYKKYDNKDGKYKENKNYRFLINNKVKNNYESYLYEKVKTYLEDNNILEENISLYIKKGNYDLLRINHEVKKDKIEILPLMKLIVIRNAIDEKIIKMEDNMLLDKSDLVGGSKIYNVSNIGASIKLDRIINEAYINGDNAAKNILDRYLAYRGIRINEYFSDEFKDHDYINFSVKDIIKVIELYNNKSNTLNSVFDHYLREKNDLFLKSIYSNVGNQNILNKKGNIYDYGVVNTNSKYYYAIFLNNIEEKHINNIGDLINRTIEEVENIRSIQTRWDYI